MHNSPMNYTHNPQLFAYPNNPDGAVRAPRVRDKHRVVCDMVYNWGWNHFPTQDLDCDVTVFSLSKCTGHCGSRFGWVVAKDQRLVDAAKGYLIYAQGGVAVEAQARASHIVQHIVATNSTFFGKARALVEARWDELEPTLVKCVQAGTIAAFNQANRGPLLWLTPPAGKDAYALLAAAGIHGEDGGPFGEQTPGHARVNMVVDNGSFALVTARLVKLCALPADNAWALADAVPASVLQDQVRAFHA